jgi:ABC-type transport system involved in multi-copper enzyme maturation permease subunit
MGTVLFDSLVGFEIKKMLLNKITITMLILCMGFLFGFTMLRYLVLSPEDRFASAKEIEINGRVLDDELIGEIVKSAKDAGGLSSITPDSQYYYVARYLNKAVGNSFSNDDLGKLSEESFYKARAKFLESMYDSFGLSEEEKKYWEEKESGVNKPFVWETNFGASSMRANYMAIMALIAIILAGGLAGTFAAERYYRTEDLIISTKAGKHEIALAKILAGELFSVIVSLLMLISVQLPHVIFNGFDGLKASCQIIIPNTSHEFSAGTLLLILTGVYILGAMLVGAAAMLFSCVTKNIIASAGVVCFAVVLDLFLSVPSKYRVLSQIRYLTPIQVLNNASMTDPRLVKVGSVFLTSYQTAAIGYVLLMLLLCLGTYRYYVSPATRRLWLVTKKESKRTVPTDSK